MEMKRGVSKKREGTTGIRFVTLCGKRFLTQQECKFSQEKQKQCHCQIRVVAEGEIEDGEGVDAQRDKDKAFPRGVLLCLKQQFDKTEKCDCRDDEDGERLDD